MKCAEKGHSYDDSKSKYQIAAFAGRFCMRLPLEKFTYLDFFAAIEDVGDRLRRQETACMSATAYADGMRRERVGGGVRAHAVDHVRGREAACVCR